MLWTGRPFHLGVLYGRLQWTASTMSVILSLHGSTASVIFLYGKSWILLIYQRPSRSFWWASLAVKQRSRLDNKWISWRISSGYIASLCLGVNDWIKPVWALHFVLAIGNREGTFPWPWHTARPGCALKDRHWPVMDYFVCNVEVWRRFRSPRYAVPFFIQPRKLCTEAQDILRSLPFNRVNGTCLNIEGRGPSSTF